MLLSMWMCGSTRPGAMMPPCASNTGAPRPDAAPAGLTAAIRPPSIQISRSGRMRSV